MKQNKLEQKLIQKSTIQWVGYVLALPFGHGCLGTTFMMLALAEFIHETVLTFENMDAVEYVRNLAHNYQMN